MNHSIGGALLFVCFFFYFFIFLFLKLKVYLSVFNLLIFFTSSVYFVLQKEKQPCVMMASHRVSHNGLTQPTPS